MASIVRTDNYHRRDIEEWLRNNCSNAFIYDYGSLITFEQDEDACAFVMKFGGVNITYAPEKFNKQVKA